MSRNRDETSQKLLDAALAVLAEDGFSTFGVNAVARRAGCDKKLIYRYFDGIEGLAEAMGQSVADRLAAALGPHLAPPPISYGAMVERLALALFGHIWGNDAYRHLKMMEVAAPSRATDSFRRARGRVLQTWVATVRGDLAAPSGVDTAALNATIIAAVEGAAILGAAGLDVADPATPDRLRRAIITLVRAAYPETVGDCGPP